MMTLICGHSRAGKTTYSTRYTCPVIHLDDTHSYAKVLEKVKRITGDVVVEGIYYDPAKRRSLVETYRGNGCKCICLDTPLEIRQKRLGHQLKVDYPFLIPTVDEGWEEIIIIRGENDVERISG